MKTNISTLEAVCEQHQGQCLFVQPFNGHGWFHEDKDVFKEQGGVPPPFRVRVERFCHFRGNLRGFVSKIEQPEFRYNGFWMVCVTRHLGTFNFRDKLAHYNLMLCPLEPIEGDPAEAVSYAEWWPVWHLRGHPQASGFGMIAETLQNVEDYEVQLRAGSGGASTFQMIGILPLPESHSKPTGIDGRPSQAEGIPRGTFLDCVMGWLASKWRRPVDR